MKTLMETLRPPAPEVMMAKELDDARRSLLEAQTARDYANSMVMYHETRIDRLRAQLDLEMQRKPSPNEMS